MINTVPSHSKLFIKRGNRVRKIERKRTKTASAHPAPFGSTRFASILTGREVVKLPFELQFRKTGLLGFEHANMIVYHKK